MIATISYKTYKFSRKIKRHVVHVAFRIFLKLLSNLVLNLNDMFDKGKDHK